MGRRAGKGKALFQPDPRRRLYEMPIEVTSALPQKSDRGLREAISLAPWLQPGGLRTLFLTSNRFNGFRASLNR
jgi:hypothetical protein